MANFLYRLTCWTLISTVVFSLNAQANEMAQPNPRDMFRQISGAAVATTLFKALKLEQNQNSLYGITEGEFFDANHLPDSDLGDFNGPWLTKHGLSPNGRALIRSIRDSGIHGLNPEAYELSSILETIQQIEQFEESIDEQNLSAGTQPSSNVASLRATLDSQLNDSFIKLATHFGRGAVRAKKVQRQMFRNAPKVNPQEWLNAVNTGQITVDQAFDSLMPREAAYHRLKNRMQALLTERAMGSRRIIVEESIDVAAENVAEDLQRVKLKLVELSILPGRVSLAPVWDDQLQFAVESFQQMNGIPVSGELDTKTRVAMNASVEEEITAIALSMERWRWMPRDLGHQHLFVNVPDYKVRVRKGNQTILTMDTVVGTARHSTPTFSENLQYIVFNPTWTVPKSITNRELMPKERKNPGYLKSRNFDIMRRDGDYLIKVPYEEVTAEDYAAERFPYVLQQRSGKDNALGRMKFMMPNPYNIYLHDTQAKDLFTHHDRAYSHGCIRLSDPDTMAKILMREDGFTNDEIEAALALTDRKLIRFKTPIPTHLTYMTTWIDEYGELNRRADVYNYDEALISALKSKNTLLSTLDDTTTLSSNIVSAGIEG